MNRKMFLKVADQADIQLDFEPSIAIKPNTIKCLKVNNTFMVYAIDAHLNKQLIIETNNEGRVYKAILKHLDIKLNHHGDIIKTPTKAR
jgi:hypothetical protein